MKRLFLFDIDGTLINSNGAGRNAIRKAIADLYGVTVELEIKDIAGKTDAGIINSISDNLYSQGIEIEREIFISKYLEYLELQQSEISWLPDAKNLVINLKNAGHAVGILTGNLRDGAIIKLGEMAGLFEIIAGGDDFILRDDIVEIALNLFHSVYSFLPDEVIIIGDTPADISCARTANGIAVAVTTGPYNRHELSAADYVLDSLEQWHLLPW